MPGPERPRRRNSGSYPHTHPTKELGEEGPGAQQGEKAAAPSGPFEPQLAKLGDTPPQGGQWVHEIKWDGYRILATVAEGNVQLWSRNALEWTGKLPEIRDAIAALGLTSAAMDGELIAGAGTNEDFNLLQATLSGERQGVLTYALFDLLHLDGVDIADAPLLERKALLHSVLEGQGRPLAFSSHVQGMATRPIAWPVSSTSKASFPSAPIAATTAAAVRIGERPNSWPATSSRWSDTPRRKAAAPGSARCCWRGQTRNMAGSTSAASGPGSRTN